MTRLRFRPFPTSRSGAFGRGLALLALPLLLAACASSPPVHYYTLQGPAPKPRPCPAQPRRSCWKCRVSTSRRRRISRN